MAHSLKAVFNTKSNYKNANGIQLDVVDIEIKGSPKATGKCKGRVTCWVPFYGFSETGAAQGEWVNADFTYNELVELKVIR